ncbi:hypothetical protein RYH80_02485 [Halobaculum sp. MBLA0147]|uniref:hypothetical protein n=1 Tax=Halobaculum sp. MBLA0147 TaxID=3079934 RepID=UPI00352488A9
MGRALERVRGGVDRLDEWTDGDADGVVIATLGLSVYVAETLLGTNPAWYYAAPFLALLVSAFRHPLWRRYRAWSVDDETARQDG